MNSGSALIARITKPVDFLAQKARREKIYRTLWNRAVLNPIKTLVRPLTAGLLFGIALGVIAAPQGGNVTAGSGTISTPDAHTTVVKQNSNNLVVHWNSFNLAQDETVRFRQPSVQSQALNRIFDQNPSQIHGRINANGRVLLVNPSGIFFSPTARVNVGALIASGLPISEQDFMRGKYNFSPAATGEGGVIINRGLLQAATGGSINLIGGAVSNEGMILAEAGQVNLGAGRRATIDFDGDGLLRFSVDEEILANAHNLDAAVSNSGEIKAEGGSVLLTAKAAQDVFSQVVNNSGVISAGRIQKQDGEIKLIAGGAGSSVLNTGTLDTSSGHSNGGRIGIEAGGSITLAEDALDGTGVENSDPAPSGQDEIVLQTPVAGEPADQGSLLLGSEIEISADSVNLGGEVNVDGASGGTIGVEAGDQIVLNGTLSGLGETGQGGQVELIGMDIDINRQAHIDVSGLLGGGTIQVGGSERGGDLRGRRAKELTVEEGARFDADALERGDGGRVIFWSDATRFAGHIQALGGPLGGDGGFAEVSGHHLWMTGHADLRAPQGDWGELLLDPGTVTICEDGAAGCVDDPVGAPADTFTDTFVNTQLGMGDLSIDTADASVGPLDINLTDTVDLNWTTASVLTLTAGNDINLAGSITAMSGSLGLNFVNQLDFAGASVGVGTVMATGGGAASILQGPATGANFWTVSGAFGSADEGTLRFGSQTVSFSRVGNLNGGAGVDTFNVNRDLSGNIEGGAGNNIYNLDSIVFGSITGGADADTFVFDRGFVGGMVDGAGGTNTFDYGVFSFPASVDITLTGLGGTTGFAGASLFGGGFDDITNLVGRSASTDSLQGLDADATFTLASAGNTYVSGGRTLDFSNIENLIGGSMADTFEVSAAHSGNLRGGDGADIFTISAPLTGDLLGGDGADIFNVGALLTGSIFGEAGTNTYNMLSGGSVIGTISGVAGATNTLDYSAMFTQVDVTLNALGGTEGFAGTSNITGAFDNITSLIGGSATDDTLRGRDADATFTLASLTVDTYESGGRTLSFRNIENLVGGSMADTFNVNARLRGNIEGGAGDNIYNLNSGGSVTGITGITGGAGDEIFNINASYTLDLFGLGGADTFNVNGILRGNIEGGAGDNIYNLNFGNVMGNITGGADADTFVFNGGSVTGTVDGAGGANTLDYNARTAQVAVALTGLGGTAGFAGTASETGGFDDITNLVGGSATSDSLTGQDQVVTFTVNTANGGTYESTNVLGFSNIESLTGGAMADTFTVNAALAGSITGGAGANIYNLESGGSVSGGITAGGGDEMFNINGAFTADLNGQGGADTFNLNAALTGLIEGGAGDDTFILGATGSASGGLNGGLDSDTLQGRNIVSTFNIAGVGSTYEAMGGGFSQAFSDIENLQGGTMADTFTVSAALAGSITGGDGANIYNLNTGGSVAGGITAGAGDEIFNINGAFTADLNGQGGADIFNIGAALTGLIEGGAGDDTFILGDSGSASGGLDGGADSDTFQGRDVASTFNVAGGSSTYQTTGGGFSQAFSNIENLRGGSMADTFTVSAAHSGNLQGGGGADVFTLMEALTGSIEGGAGANIYNLNSGGSIISGGITAGADDETFNINAAYTLDLDGLGGADTFNVGSSGDLTGAIVGGAGANIYNFNGGSVVGLTAGGAGVTETFNINADTTLSSLDGGVGTDIFNLNAVLTGSISGGFGSNTYNLNMNGEVTETITGGANLDAFVFNGGSVTGMIDGAGGTNTLDYNALGSQVQVALTGLGSTMGFDGTATGTGGFNDITNLVGGTAMTDTLTGQNQIATFTVNTANGGTYDSTNMLGFSNIESLTGGAMADTFTVGAALAGSITGGAGANIYDLNTGGSVAGGITAGGGDETFNINAAYTLDLDGLGGADTFNVSSSGDLTGTIVGGAGANIYNFNGGIVDGLTAGGGGVTETFNINANTTLSSLDGGAGTDIFNIGAVLTGSISGGVGSNIYNLESGGSVTGDITAGADGEEFNINGDFTADLNGQGGADTFTVNAALTGDIEGGTGANTYNLNSGGAVTGGITAGADDETFNINADYTIDLAGLGGADLFNLNAALTGLIAGGAGDDTFILGDSGSASGGLDGGLDSDTFEGRNVASTFNVAGFAASTYQTTGGGFMQAFSNIENLRGGSAADTFTVTAAHSGNLQGGGGADVFMLTDALTGSIEGGAGANIYNLNSGGSVTGGITGGADADDFVFDGGSVTGTVDGVGGVNTLDYNALASQVDVVLTGLGGTAGFDGTATDTGGFNDITNLVGGSAMTDSLTGQDQIATFTVNTANGGTYGSQARTLDFSNIESLTGGSMVDTFTVGDTLAGSITGGDGANLYNLNTGGSVAGGITAGAGDEIFNINGAFTADLNGQGGADTFIVGAALTGLIEGGAGNDTFILGDSGSASGGLDGGLDSDTFQGRDVASTFNIAGVASTYEAMGGGFSQAFSNIENLLGGSAADTFTVTAAHSGSIEGGGGADIFTLMNALTGSIEGGTGANTYNLESGGSVIAGITAGADGETFNINAAYTLDLDGLGGADTFNIASGGDLTGTIVGGAGANIYNFEGGSVGGLIASGAGVTETFNINADTTLSTSLDGGVGTDIFNIRAVLTGSISGGVGSNTYNLNSGGSVNGTIIGGANFDGFVFDGGSVTGMVDGAGGTNTLDYNALGSQVDVTLTGLGSTVGFDGTATGTGGFNDITNLVGGSATSDSLTGQNQIATFTVNTANGGTYESTNVLGFSGIESLTGGSMVDIFTVHATLAGSITGGDGANIYNLNTGGSVMGGITAGAGDETFNINGAFTADLNGQGGADTFNLNAVLTGLIEGGAGDDTFILGATGSASGGLNGGLDSDTLQGRNIVSTFNIAGVGSTYEAMGGFTQTFSNVENLRGGTMVDTFTVSAAHSGNLQGGGGADVFTLTDALTGSIEGGAGANIYNLDAGGSVTGGITAGTGDETFNINDDYTIDLAGLGGADTFNLDAALTGMIEGGAGDDTFILDDSGSASGGLDGGADSDTFQGRNVASTFNVAGAASTYEATGGFSQTFSNIENLRGGSMADTFTVSAAHTGSIEGGAGANVYNLNSGGSLTGSITAGADDETFNINAAYTLDLDGLGGADTFDVGAALTGSITGGAGDDTFTLGAGGSASDLDGGADTDTLQGRDADATFTIAGTGNTYMSGSLTQSFSDIENLQGGNMIDTFEVSAAHTGDLRGGDGPDVFGVSATLTGNIDGEMGADVYNMIGSGMVTGMINGVGGSGGMDTLDFSGMMGQVDITLTGLGADGFAGTSNVAGTFDNIINLIGGDDLGDSLTGLDAVGTFTVNAADGGTYESTNMLSFSGIENLIGGSMADTFDIINSGGSLTGSITGGLGANIYNFEGGSVGGLIAGGAGVTETFNINANTTLLNLDGGVGTDIFNLDAVLTGNISGGVGSNTYNLNSGGSVNGTITGGANADNFVFNGGSVTGMVDGAGGTNTLNYNALGSQVDVTLTGLGGTTGFAGTASGTGGFDDITNLVGGTATTDTLQGLDADATFNLAATNNYMSGGNTLMFSAIEDLQGGSMIDTFTVTAAHSGTLSGGAGNDIFTLTDALTGDIEGEAGDNTYNLNGGGSVSGTITGGANADTFVFNGGSVTGMVDGAGGVNTLDYNQLATQVDITLTGLGGTTGFTGTASQTGGFDDITNLVGGSAMTDSLTGQNQIATFTVNTANGGTYQSTNMLGFSSIESLTGGAMADTFTVDAALAGSIIGGNGANIYNLNTGSVTGGITAGGGDEIFNINGAFTANLNGQGGADTFTVDAALTGLIEGGAGANIYNLNTGGSVTGDITGGGGDEMFNINGAFTANLNGQGGADTFNLMAALTGGIDGGAGANTYNLNSGGSVSMGITGGDDADTFVFNGGSVTGLVDGAGGVNTLDYNTRTAQVAVTLTGTGSTVGFAGMASDIGIPGFDDITNLVGGSAMTDSLTGQNQIATFTVNAANGGTYGSQTRTLDFSSIESLTGGAMVDTFIVGAALAGSITGGDGANLYNLNAGGSVAGGITGGGGDEMFNINGAFTADLNGQGGADTFNIDAALTGNIVGGAGSDTFTLDATGSASDLDGGTDIDTFRGRDAVATFGIDGTNTYEISGSLTQSFSNIENLQGGTMADTFTVSAAHTGSIEGGAGANVYNLNSGGSLNGSITAGGGDEEFNINADYTLNLDGLGGADTFNMGAVLTGNIGGGAGDNTYNLNMNGQVDGAITGGVDADDFVFNGGSVTGMIDGAGGVNTLDYTTRTVQVAVALTGLGSTAGFTGTASDIGTSFDDITNLVGGSATSDSLTGQDQIATFTVNTANGGTYESTNVLGFSNIESLTGGAMADTFTVGDTLAGSITGGGGANVYNLNTGSVAGGITAGGGDEMFNINGDFTADLNGQGGADTFTVDAVLTGDIEGGAGANIYNLNSGGSVTGGITAGADDETFNINAAYTLNLDGLGGADTFNVASGGDLTGTIIGGDGANIYNFNGGSVDGLTAGGAGVTETFNIDADTTLSSLDGSVGTDIFNLNAVLTGNIGGGAGDNTYNLNSGGSVTGAITGGVDVDDFVFNGGSVTGMIDGAGGVNTLDYTTRTAQVDVTLTGLGGTTGFAGSATGIMGPDGFDDITNLVGGDATTDTLQGQDADATFNLAATNNYMSGGNTLMFSAIEDLQGGSMIDTFIVSAAHSGTLSGGAGNDIFTLTDALTGTIEGEAGDNTYNLDGGGSVSLGITGGDDADTFVFNGGSVTGLVDGAGGVNTFDYNLLSSQVDITLTGLGGTVGFDGTATDTGGFNDITNLVGGDATTDTLQGRDADATFNLAATNNYMSGGNTLMFSAIEDLQGGSMIDTFIVSTAHSGTLSGGAGNDIFTLTAALTGTIEGEAGDNTYNLDGGGSVSLGITGGADADTFVFNGGSVTGLVDGAGGANTLDYNQLSSQVDITLTGLGGMTGFAGSATGIMGPEGFDDITNLVGGDAMTDTLQGRDADATFNLAATNNYMSGGNTLMFSAIEDLQGGSMIDTFIVSAAHSGDLQGGGGADIFTLMEALTGGIEGGTGANIYNLESGGSVSDGITAGADGETFNINAAYTLNLDGLGGADTFNVGSSGDLTGTIVGGAGANIYNFNGGSVDGLTAGGAGVTETFNIDADTTLSSLDGSVGTDIFNLNAVLTGNIGGGAGDNTYNLNSGGSVTGAITGGVDVDDFVFNGGSVTGMIDGAGGVNTLDYTTRTAQVDVTLTGLGGTTGFAGSATGIMGADGFDDITNLVGGDATTDTLQGRDADATFNLAATNNYMSGSNTLMFSAIEDLQGGSMIDTFIVSAAHSGTLSGGAGNDIFTLTDALTGTIEGEAGDNTYNLDGGGSVSMGITGGADADTFVFNSGSVTGLVDGAGGVNTLDYNLLSSQVDITLTGLGGMTGFAGSATGIMGPDGFDDITNLVGGDATTDTLQGQDAVATFTVNTANGGTYGSQARTLDFSNIESLTGGTLADTFDVGAALAGSITGGDGANIYNLNVGSVAGGITGGGGDEMFNINGAFTADLNGQGGADTFNIDEALTGMIQGGLGTNIYNLNSGGSVSMGITGGADADTFVFNSGSVTGLVDGAGGVNTLDYNQLSSQVDIILTGLGGTTGFAGSATGIMGADGFDDITNLVGGDATTDTLQGRDADATFNLAATNNYMSGSNTLMFSAIEDLQGGSMIDTFIVSAAHSGTLSGGAGNDIFTLTAALTGTIAGEAGDNTYNLDGGGSVSLGITGGADADTFVFNDGSVTGLVDGAGGVNTLDYNQLSSQVDITLTGLGGTTGFAGSATGIMGPEGFNDITNLVGGDATTDTLQGLDADATFNLAATNNYMSGGNTLMFSDIENLQGGSMIDTFIVSEAHSGTLSGGAGNDIFTLTAALTGTIEGEAGDNTYNLDGSGSVSAGITGGADDDTFVFNSGSVTGLVDGAGGVNTLDYNQLPSQVDITLTGLGGTTGFAGSATGIMGPEGFDDITDLVGGDATTDTLQGQDAVATFTVNTANGGTYGSQARTLDFSNIESLTGGTLADTFDVGAALAGSITGGDGANIYNLNVGSVAGGITGGGGDEMFNINGAFTADLNGQGGADTFNIDEALTGMIQGGLGTNIYNLNSGGSVSMGITGGADADTFVFNGGSVTGLVDGAGGVNTLDYNQLSSQVDVVLTDLGGTTGFAGTANDIGTGFDDITNVVGGTATTDTLQGRDADATFTLAATNNYMSGSNTLMFSAIEDLQGGSMIDTFIVSAAHSGTLRGGAGNDIFTLTAALTGTIEGEAGVNTYNLDGGGSVSLGITGGADADIFVFNGGSVTGLVDGAGGANTLDYNQLSSQVDITLTGLGGTVGFDGTATDTGGFNDITDVVGGTAITDTLLGLDAIATFTLASTRNTYESTNTLDFSNIEDLQGGNAVDTFTVSAGHSGTLSGGAGNDIFTLTAALTGDIEGEAGDNTYNLNSGGSVTEGITGGDDADTFVFNGGSVTRLVDGAGGVNTLDYNQLSSQVDITLTGLGGTTGFTGSATGATGIMGADGFDDITDLTGSGADTDMLTGQDEVAIFTLNGDDSGTYESESRTLNFESIENLVGGTNDDTFILFDDGSVDDIDGAEGENTLSYSALTSLVDITLTGFGTMIGFAGRVVIGNNMPPLIETFDDISNLVGSDVNGDRITGHNQDATFTVDTANGGTYESEIASEMRTLGFSSIENLMGGTMADTFTVGAALAGSIIGGDGANTYNLNTGGSVSGTITGGADADTFVFNGGSVTGMVDGAGGVNTLDYNALASQVDVELTGFDGTVGFDGTATDTGGFDDITNLVGGTATSDSLQGLDAVATFTLASGGNTYESTNTLDFSNIEDLQGGNAVDTFTVSAGHSGNLLGGAGNDIFTLTAALTGGIAGGAGDNVFNLSGGGGSISGIVDLAAGSNNFWYHRSGETSTIGSVTGSGSLFIPDINRGDLVIGTDLILPDDSLILPDLTGFTGHLVIGGIINPLAAPPSPYYVDPVGGGLPTILVNTETLTVAGIIPTSGTTATRPAIETGGPVTLLARNINLNNGITAGGMIGLVAAATRAGEGLITLAGGEVTLTAPAGTTRPSGAFIASNFVNPINLVLAFSGGEVDIAVGSGTNIQVSGRSENAASTDDLAFVAFRDAISTGRTEANVPVRICTSATCLFDPDAVPVIPAIFPPDVVPMPIFAQTFALALVTQTSLIAELIGLKTVASIDIGLFEEDLTLYGQIGTGIALALAQCEEQEGCAPNVTEEELDILISGLEEKVAQLEGLLDEELDDDERPRIEQLLLDYNMLLRDFRQYRESLREFFAVEDEVEEEEIQSLEEELAPVPVQPGAVKKLTGILENIKSRLEWLEGLKSDPEALERLGERSNIDLTPEVLDAIIESTRSEAQFIEDSIRRFIEGVPGAGRMGNDRSILLIDRRDMRDIQRQYAQQVPISVSKALQN